MLFHPHPNRILAFEHIEPLFAAVTAVVAFVVGWVLARVSNRARGDGGEA
jgi:hypothetical protein